MTILRHVSNFYIRSIFIVSSVLSEILARTESYGRVGPGHIFLWCTFDIQVKNVQKCLNIHIALFYKKNMFLMFSEVLSFYECKVLSGQFHPVVVSRILIYMDTSNDILLYSYSKCLKFLIFSICFSFVPFLTNTKSKVVCVFAVSLQYSAFKLDWIPHRGLWSRGKPSPI